jgi:Asp-tRNA(Asn)/Glu-tRNA(Gln) amidotransferase A subunit family amidase
MFANRSIKYAAVIIPTGKADKGIDGDELARPDKTRNCESIYCSIRDVADLCEDRSEDIHGAPTAIQLVARNFQDEELIAVSRVVDRCLRDAMA